MGSKECTTINANAMNDAPGGVCTEGQNLTFIGVVRVSEGFRNVDGTVVVKAKAIDDNSQITRY
jgi:hypothetical protein